MMREKEVVLHFNHGKLKFSVGHFTIFSATERETLHGHNYSLEVVLTTSLGEPGIAFDYRLFDEKLISLCQQLNWHFLIPGNSPYVQVEEDDSHYQITFNGESMWLLKKDVVVLPLDNVTLETLSQWFVDELKKDHAFIQQYRIKKIKIKVFNGPHHAAEAKTKTTDCFICAV
ncbi:MAG: 6-pyruvoyl tetrahydropterin synthase [uncultured bacterium]|nr:MAG: 6-pyruvoyl tetrahydropterin synthase [uncultured bacterium]